ncbi:MAG: hypothetical protein WCS42_10645 [Verrucomicrobiota bacterium]
MNPDFKTVTLPELFNDIFTPATYKNFIPKYRAMLLDAVAGQNEAAGSNRNPDVIEAAASEVERLLPQALRLFKLIATRPGGNITGGDYNLMQTALHEAMLKALYHINRNCRTLLEAQIDYEKYESIESYSRIRKKRFGFSDELMLEAMQEWYASDEATFYNLVERETKLKVFDTETDGVCFQIYNAQKDEVLHVLPEMHTDNGLAISKRYFFFRIFQVFQHLYLNTQLLELEKPGVATVETIEKVEVGTELMDAFNQAAKEML